MALDIWSNQFNIVGGQVREEGPFVAVFEGTRQAAGVGVYVVAEPVGAASARLCDEVLDVVARAFGSPEPALTANLLRALSAGHQHVQEWNRLHGAEGAAGVGVSCLAVRDNEAYLAQCGPALVVAHTGGRFRVAAPSGDDSRRPLGLGDRAAPVFTRFTLAVADVLLLAFSATDRLVDRGTLISLVSAPPDEAMPALYVRVRSADSFGALYLGAVEKAPPAAVDQQPGSDVRRAAAPTPLPPPRPRIPPAPASEPARGPGRPPAADPRAAPLPDRAGGRPAAGVGNGSPRRPGSAQRHNALGALGEGARLPSRGTLIVIAAVVVVILIVWLGLPALADRGNDDRFQELLRTADSTVAGADTAADPARRRTLLNRAESDLLEARALRPDSGQVTERLSRISQALAALDGNRELSGLADVADLGDAGIAPQTGVSLVVATRVYLLDPASGKVLAFSGRAGEAPETVFEAGRSVGPDRTGKARHIVLVPGTMGRPGTVLVLDDTRRLYALADGGQARPLSLPAADAWKGDTALAATVSDLYVLDAPGERIWRYTVTPGGYEGGSEPLVSRPALRAAVDLSISGTPIVATNDGRLLRITDGREEELRPAALDRPLAGPSAPMFNPGDNLMYVPDRGNRRIVRLDANGVFQGQLVHRRLSSLRAVALDEAHDAIYAVSGQTLVTAPLPHQ